MRLRTPFALRVGLRLVIELCGRKPVLACSKTTNGFRYIATLAALACNLMLSTSLVFAQNQSVNLAADRINTVIPPALPQQTILIGLYDGATKTFSWLLPESYPPGTPDYKKAEYGGPMQPQHVANINSYNIQYRFNIVHRPANFQLTLQVTGANGQVVDKIAVVDNAGASVSFNPTSAAFQKVKIQPGNLTLTIVPHLSEQLGAFVVPRMLIAILYDPPGEGSSSSYSNTSTAGTVLSWDFARTSGIVETVDPNQWMEIFKLGVQGITAAAGVPAAGQVMGAFTDLFKDPTVETTTTITRAESSSKGTFFSVTHAFATDDKNLYPYPGKGDAYIILHDVLFVYFAKGGKVYLAPVAYSKGIDKLMPWQLKDYLAPILVERYLALDPMVNNMPPTRLATKSLPGRFGSLAVLSMEQPRFRYVDSIRCQLVVETFGYTWETVQSSGVSQTTTQTVVEKGGGFLAQLAGGSGQPLWGITYTTSVQQIAVDKEVAALSVQCSEAPGYWVDVYYDSIYRTLLGVRGEPLMPPSSPMPMSGSISDEQGLPISKQRVSLVIGDGRYTVLSDQKGNFQFPIRSLPKGAGSLIVGKSATQVAYNGTPVTTNLRIPRNQLPTAVSPPTPQPLVSPFLGGVRPRGVESEAGSPTEEQTEKPSGSEPPRTPEQR